MRARIQIPLLLVLTILAGLACGLDLGLIAFIRQQLPLCMGLDAGQIGIVVASGNMGWLFSSLASGWLSDAWGRKRTLFLCTSLTLLAPALMLLSHEWKLLSTARVLSGAYGCSIGIVLSLLLAECLPANRRGMGSAILQVAVWSGYLISTAIAALATRALAGKLNALPDGAPGADAVRIADQAWRHLTWLFFIPAGLLFAAAFTAPQSPRWLYQKGRKQEALAELLRLRGESQARHEFHEMEEMERAANAEAHLKPGANRENLLQVLTHRHFRNPLLIVLALCVLQNANGFGVILFFSADLLAAAGFDKVAANQAGIWMAAAICLGTALSIPFMDRLGRRKLLMAGMFLTGLSLCKAFELTWRIEHGLAATPHTGWTMCYAMTLYGLGMGLGPCSCFWALISELLPTRIRSIGIGVGAVILSLVTMATQVLFLPLTLRYGLAANIGVWLAASVLYFLFVHRFLPETKGKTLEEIEADFVR